MDKENGVSQTPSTRDRETYHVSPVGYVRREGGRVVIDVLPAFAPALKELETFSHVQVFWWFNRFDDESYRKTTRFEDMPFEAPLPWASSRAARLCAPIPSA